MNIIPHARDRLRERTNIHPSGWIRAAKLAYNQGDNRRIIRKSKYRGVTYKAEYLGLVWIFDWQGTTLYTVINKN